MARGAEVKPREKNTLIGMMMMTMMMMMTTMTMMKMMLMMMIYNASNAMYRGLRFISNVCPLSRSLYDGI